MSEALDKIETGRNLKGAWHVLIPTQLRILIEKIAKDEDRHPGDAAGDLPAGPPDTVKQIVRFRVPRRST